MSVFCFYNVRKGVTITLWEYNPTVCSTLGFLQSKLDSFKEFLSFLDSKVFELLKVVYKQVCGYSLRVGDTCFAVHNHGNQFG